MHIIRSYGWSLHTSGYGEQTSKLENLLGDLENDPQYSADVTTINGTDWLSYLKTAFTDFKSLVEERREEASEEPDYTTQEARKEVKAALNALFNYVEIMHDVDPAGPYQQFANEVNPLIDEIMRITRARRSRGESEEETP